MSLNRIGIVGLGLIGGSIGLDLQKIGYEVHGLVHKEQTRERAKERGLATIISTSPEILSNCSVIILALPLSQIVHPSSELTNALPRHAVITDVGSVKAPVIEVWKELHPRFIGSHPMAGTIETGVEAGRRNLFQNRPWIITPGKNNDEDSLNAIKELASALGSNWITTDPQTHDEAVALISHLPIFIGAALLKTVSEGSNQDLIKLAKLIASSGFEDTSRVGGGNPELGVAMATHNTSAILSALDSYFSSIHSLEEMIRTNQWIKLKEELKSTQQHRRSFIKPNKIN